MKQVDNFDMYDEYIECQIKEAKRLLPGFNRYEITEDGTLYCFSLGAYPHIVKNFCEAITIV
jgi:hypothetical protein